MLLLEKLHSFDKANQTTVDTALVTQRTREMLETLVKPTQRRVLEMSAALGDLNQQFIDQD